jgi:hydrogenase maturation protein HypF
MVNIICRHYPLNKIVLTGGVFQNSILLEQLKNYLQALNFHVLTPSLIPCNDGGLSLGQAVIAAANFHRKRR